ncbi:MFS transporter [Actinoplanes cyaneus]|uniref:MFS transporter n=1 Tax=Actinoplanes cyaneus TaxID=52696 RepID=A0A919IMC0_9ACTN|nr:MDR family MFS transporter [Actinoplanes cyaneus]MCW2141353.1 drug resistance transporter, EmrB/QacA subfamily [Actinoplanes cyaneus]GID68013.1 MFS transporter [Actinoplanes cyaneus]
MTATPVPADTAEAGGRMTHREVVQALSGLMLGMFVSILASTVVANALPTIIAELGGSQSVYTWIVTTELLAMTATVPLWGKMADLYSKKLLIQLSLGLFVVGSLIAGLAPNVEILLVSRIAQGVGAGGMSALAMIVMAAMIPPRELGRYSGMFGAVFGVATIAGPLIGGVLVDTSWLGWRWCFLIGVPFSIAAILMLQKTLHLPVTRREVKIDWLGALLITAGVSTLLIWSTLAGPQHFAWISGTSAAFVAGGLVLLALAVWVESRAAEPIIPLGIFRHRTVSLTVIASVLVGVAMFGGTVFLSQYFQISLGKSPTVAGLMSLPMIFGLLVSSTVAGQLITKFGRWKIFLVAGAVVMTGGMLLLSTIGADTSVPLISVYMAVLGIGVGMLMQNLVLAAQNDVPATELGATTSALTFFRSMGGSIGVSALGAVLAAKVTSLATEKFGAAAGSGGSAKVPDLATLPPEARAIFEDIYGTATAHLFMIGAPIAFLAVIAVLFIKEKPLSTLTGDERAAQEQATAALH